MAKKIIWSFRAIQDRKEIFSYWDQRNKSDSYSRKLDNLFLRALQIITLYPSMGRRTNKANVRIKIVRDYFLIYEILGEQIILLSIWDSRQNPEKLEIYE